MTLTYEQILSATGGTVRHEENELGLELHRFSRRQEGFFYQTNPHFCRNSFFNGYFGKNCRSTSGVTLDFYTDSAEFSVEFGANELVVGATVQLFDLYVDGLPYASFPADAPIHTSLPGKNVRVTLYFPCFNFPIVKSVTLSDSASFVPAVKPMTLLTYGDSITHGANALHTALTWVNTVARELDIGVVNQANSGFIYDEGSVIDRDCNPKLIICAYGINDYGHFPVPKDLAENAAAFLRKVRTVYPDAKLAAILPIWTSWDSENPHFADDKRAALTAVYAELCDATIDGHDLVPHDTAYLTDPVHPNDEGFRHYGKNMAEKVRQLLQA